MRIYFSWTYFFQGLTLSACETDCLNSVTFYLFYSLSSHQALLKIALSLSQIYTGRSVATAGLFDSRG